MNLPNMAISIRQPWAWAIVCANKDIENRNWYTRYRGPICIHAAKGMTKGEYEDCLDTCNMVAKTHPFKPNMEMPSFNGLERGKIIGTANIIDCVIASKSPWFFGKYGFVLANAEPIAPIPVKGALGIFDWRQRVNNL